MASQPPKKNTAYTMYIGLKSQANPAIFQDNPTLAAADFQVAVDDGAPSALDTTPTVDADFTKRVKISLSADEMNGDVITVLCSDAAGDEWCDVMLDIHTSTNQIDDLASDASRAEPAQGAPPATTDFMTKVDYLYKAWRNKVLTTATQISVYDDAGTTVDHKSTISDDGTTFTKGEYTSGP